MKTKHLLLTALTAAIFSENSAQTILSEDFTTTMPFAWTQTPTSGLQWKHGNYGLGKTGCAVIYGDGNFGTKYLQVPKVDISKLDEPRLSFKVAVVQENFVIPTVSVVRDTKSGWQTLSSWAHGVGMIPIKQTYDFAPPLTDSNVYWLRVTLDLSSLPDSTDVDLAFAADFSNGGWVLIDSVRIYDASQVVYSLPYTQDFEGSAFLPKDWEDNSTDLLNQWEHSDNIGAFGNSKGCAYIDNYNNMPATQGSSYAMRTVLLDLSNTPNPVLQFDYAYALHSLNPESDILSVMYLYPGGNWTELVRYDNADLTTANKTQDMFIPNNAEWRTKVVDLSQFFGPAPVRFAINCFSYSSGNNVLYIDNVSFREKPTSSVGDGPQLKNIDVYPNPTSDKLFIDLGSEQISNVCIYDVTGRLIKHLAVNNKQSILQVNTDGWKNGTYIVKLESAGYSTTKRIALVR